MTDVSIVFDNQQHFNKFYCENLMISGKIACGKTMLYSFILKHLIQSLKDVIVLSNNTINEKPYDDIKIRTLKYDESIIKSVIMLQKYRCSSLSEMEKRNSKNWIIVAFDDVFNNLEDLKTISEYIKEANDCCISFHFITQNEYLFNTSEIVRDISNFIKFDNSVKGKRCVEVIEKYIVPNLK